MYSDIKTSLVKNLPSNILAQLFFLNIGNDGQMRSVLIARKDAEVFYVEDEQGKVMSWGMAHNGFFFKNHYTVNLFTAQAHRGKALASRILQTIKSKHSNLYGCYDRSAIFERYGCKDVVG